MAVSVLPEAVGHDVAVPLVGLGVLECEGFVVLCVCFVCEFRSVFDLAG